MKNCFFCLTFIFSLINFQIQAQDIFKCASEGDLACVKKLVEKGTDVDTIDSLGITPFHYAVVFGQIGTAKYLLSKGAKINVRDMVGNTPLISVIEFYNGQFLPQFKDLSILTDKEVKEAKFETVKFLVDNGADVNALTGQSPIPLIHLVALKGEVEILKYLIERGANVNALGMFDHSILENSIGNLEVVRFLIEKGANVNAISTTGSPLTSAIQNKNFQTVKFLIEKGANINSTVDPFRVSIISPLHIAVQSGHFETVKFLIEKGANINSTVDYSDTTDVTPLHIAVQSGHFETVKFLIEKGASIEQTVGYRFTNNVAPLHVAVQFGHFEIVKYLVEKRANINTMSKSDLDSVNGTPLHWACYRENIGLIEFLIQAGANINAKDNDKATALVKACEIGHFEIVKYLIKKGADINVKSDYEESALIKACYYGHFLIAEYLIEKGADVNAKNHISKTVLMTACYHGKLDLIKYLIEKGADVNIKTTSDGETALMEACYHGHFEIVKYFVEKGADINAKANRGGTALMEACISGNFNLFQYLVQKGADITAKNLDEETLLHKACQYYDQKKELANRLEIIKFLVEKGLNPNAKKYNGQTPISLAYSNNLGEEIINVLQKFSTTIKNNIPPKINFVPEIITETSDSVLHILGNVIGDRKITLFTFKGDTINLRRNNFFTLSTILTPGINTFVFTALDSSGLISKETRSIFYKKPDDPFLLRKNYALIFTFDSFATPSLQVLGNPKRDGDSLGKILNQMYGFEVISYHNLTRALFIRKINLWTQEEGEGVEKESFLNEYNQLFIFISGHGVIDQYCSEGYLAMSDSKSSDKTADLDMGSYFSFKTLLDKFKLAKRKNVLLVVDACHSGLIDPYFFIPERSKGNSSDKPIIPLEVHPNTLQEKLCHKYDNRLFLTSGGIETVFDHSGNDKKSFSVFMLTLLKALNQNTDSILTFSKIWVEIDKMPPDKRPYTEGQCKGKPEKVGPMKGNFGTHSNAEFFFERKRDRK